MFEWRAAYRFTNGEVEGFKGTSSVSVEAAKADSYDQIRRKCNIINESPPKDKAEVFDATKVMDTAGGGDSLTDTEWNQLKADWETNVRY